MNPASEMVKPVNSWYTVLVLNRLAIPLTMVLAKTNITPNQITVLSIIIRGIGIGFIWLDHPWLAVGLWAAGFLLDAVDGKLARLTRRVSTLGGKVDMWGDFILNWLFVLSLSLKELWPSYPAALISAVGLIILCTLPWVLVEGVQEKLRDAISYKTEETFIQRYATWTAEHRVKLVPVSDVEKIQVIIPIGYVFGILHLVMPVLLVYRVFLLISRGFVKRMVKLEW